VIVYALSRASSSIVSTMSRAARGWSRAATRGLAQNFEPSVSPCLVFLRLNINQIGSHRCYGSLLQLMHEEGGILATY